MYWPRLFFFHNKVHVHNLNHDNVRRSQSFISLPGFMLVSAAVSEICMQVEPEEDFENGYFQFNTSLGHIIF